MKRLACVLLAAFLAVPAFAQMKGTDMKDMDMKSEKKGASKTHKASGTVTKLDRQKSTVTISHGPVQSMQWPAMTMTFKAKDKAMLDKVKPGEKVDFEFIQQGKDYVLTSVR